jgi:hypothetical protein
MKIRLTGTRDDIDAVLPVLTAVLTVQEVSDFHPNRGKFRLGRVYLEVDGPRVTTLRAFADRMDHTENTRQPNRAWRAAPGPTARWGDGQC